MLSPSAPTASSFSYFATFTVRWSRSALACRCAVLSVCCGPCLMRCHCAAPCCALLCAVLCRPRLSLCGLLDPSALRRQQSWTCMLCNPLHTCPVLQLPGLPSSLQPPSVQIPPLGDTVRHCVPLCASVFRTCVQMPCSVFYGAWRSPTPCNILKLSIPPHPRPYKPVPFLYLLHPPTDALFIGCLAHQSSHMQGKTWATLILTGPHSLPDLMCACRLHTTLRSKIPYSDVGRCHHNACKTYDNRDVSHNVCDPRRPV